ncbi:lipid-A-disaccharide synthase-related protein [Aerosakkonemataceae cyanobacterium BLCC-F154]|uniref:Lipid-A-disaccharide synthase-related protein n=1 Tax=Floridaenema fluviatile BLCC-F154 TaxID=3153640 RepID=A0ABV4Y8P7_9CYAN
MKLLCLSNGHGEDAIAVRICQELQQLPTSPKIAALPIVGEGQAYIDRGIPMIAPTQKMPSGGFVYMDWRQLWRDVQGGLLELLWQQFQAVQAFAAQGGAIIAVGDIVPLFFAWLSGAPYVFVGTAKSEYYLRDEIKSFRSFKRRWEGWSGSVYLPWERWLMSQPRCKAVFPRDSLTAEVLRQWSIPAFDLGNPMMDDLESLTPESVSSPLGWRRDSLTVCLLPGSRTPEAYENWRQIIAAVGGILDGFRDRTVLFLSAIAPSVSLDLLQETLETQGWRSRSTQFSPVKLPIQDATALVFSQGKNQLILTQKAFNDCLQAADFAIAMAGTATEQFVGLGKPAITIPGKGPQFTYAFAEAQSRLLGPSILLVEKPSQVAQSLKYLLKNPDRLQLIAANGPRRMGKPGASHRIAECLVEKLENNS